MIFQTSVIWKKNIFAQRPLSYSQNKLQPRGLCKYYSHESRLHKTTPALLRIVAGGPWRERKQSIDGELAVDGRRRHSSGGIRASEGGDNPCAPDDGPGSTHGRSRLVGHGGSGPQHGSSGHLGLQATTRLRRQRRGGSMVFEGRWWRRLGWMRL